jgi:hypothetical protein
MTSVTVEPGGHAEASLYRERMNPSAWASLADRPALRELVRVQVDMQFADLRTLLRLPVEGHGLTGGCSLTTASLAFNLIAGFSVLFFDSSRDALTQRGERSARFRQVLGRYYPWSEDNIDRDDAVLALYEWARNPLSHSLGVTKDRRAFPGAPEVEGRPVAVMLAKMPLSEKAVDEVATARQRPSWMGPTLEMVDGALDINVVTLAWGTHEVLRRLFEDAEQADRAEHTARELLGYPV